MVAVVISAFLIQSLFETWFRGNCFIVEDYVWVSFWVTGRR